MNRPSKPEAELIATGWQLATITGGEHLKRALKMYSELGFNTELVEVDPAEYKLCTTCYRDTGESLYKIYTLTMEARS